MSAPDLDVKSAFVQAHRDWVGHADADGSKYIFDRGALVELRGLASKQAYNGLLGRAEGYIPDKDRFRVVDIGGGGSGTGPAANVRTQNLTGAAPPPPPVSAAAAADAVRASFFRPGMRYFGTIQIPGDAGYSSGDVIGCRQTYELTILGDVSSCVSEHIGSQIEGVLGPVICARHRAYEDEQYVFITLTDVGTGGGGHAGAAAAGRAEDPIPASEQAPGVGFTMQYSDAETTCEGRWDPCGRVFRGTVSQKVHSGEKIFVAADPVTHTFDLYPCHHLESHESHAPCTEIDSSDCCALSRHRTATTEALENCLHRFQDMIGNVSPNSITDMGDFSVYLRDHVRWKILLDAASLLAEKSCAYIRLVTAFIDALVFATPAARALQLQSLGAQGLSRAKVHARCDQAFTLVAQTLTWWYRIHPRQVDSATPAHVARYRLDKSYEQFSEALSSATVRLTAATLDTFARAAATALEKQETCEKVEGSGVEVESCCFCMEKLVYGGSSGVGEVGDFPLVLPCSHSFHGACIRSWLRFHAQCPMCRVVLKEEEEEEEERRDEIENNTSPQEEQQEIQTNTP
jgi:hypothetical protein